MCFHTQLLYVCVCVFVCVMPMCIQCACMHMCKGACAHLLTCVSTLVGHRLDVECLPSSLTLFSEAGSHTESAVSHTD